MSYLPANHTELQTHWTAADLDGSQPAYCVPPRYRPEHAAPVFGGPPRRWRARRAIKLVVATTSWVLALCLVVGAIALVAGATAPGRLHANQSSLNKLAVGGGDQATLRDPTRHTGPPSTRARHAPIATEQPTGQHVRHPARQPIVFTFHGTARWYYALKLASLVQARRWQLNWSYSCPLNQVGGSFTVTETRVAAAQRIGFTATAPASHGVTPLKTNGSPPHLAVTSSCPWRVRLVAFP